MNQEILTLQRELLLEQLMEVENQLNENGIKKEKQGFSLITINNVFYVQYIDPITKKQLGKKCLFTADRNEALILAKKFRPAYVKAYNDKKNGVKDLIAFFGDYYKLEKSPYLQELLKTGQRKMAQEIIKKYDSVIRDYFIPFLLENKIKRLNELTINRLKDFQIFLKRENSNKKTGGVLSNDTINDYINGAIKPIFSNLYIKGVIKETPFSKDKDFRFNLPETEKKRRGFISATETLAVLFDKDIWRLYKKETDIKIDKIANQIRYKKERLICLLMATMGLRNIEISKIKKENIIKIRRTHFYNVVEGLKTENAKRKVPIPSITLKALNEYIAENNIINDDDYLFGTGGKNTKLFSFTQYHFGALCGYTKEEMKEKNVVFYSFRHLFKTMLSHSNIKDSVIEYFMGHAVDVKKMNENYNHIGDLDDEFFEEYGLKVIEYIDEQFKNVINKLELLPIHTHLEQVSLTDDRGKTQTYFAEVLNEMDFENETFLYLTDLSEKGVLSPTNDKSQLLSELKILLESGKIDKRRYDDCVDYLKNTDFFE